MMDRAALRLAATLLVAGVVLSILVGLLHPAQADPNDHRAVFAEYAASGNWTLVHLGQFVGMAAIVAGLLALYLALGARSGVARWAGRFGAVAAVVALGLYGVLQAVDGVALKQAVDAWVRAPDVDKTARFSSAEVIRWLEWGVRSYQSFTLGLAFTGLALAVVVAASRLRPVGFLMAVSGLAYVTQAMVLGAEGFSGANTVPQLLAYGSICAWTTWLLVVAWRMEAPTVDAAHRVARGSGLAE